MNSLSYHESHSHGPLGLPFQAFSQEDPYGQYFVPYHWHEEVEFLYITKGSLVLRTQNRTRLLQEGHIYFINPGTCTDCLETVRFPPLCAGFPAGYAEFSPGRFLPDLLSGTSLHRKISVSRWRGSPFGLTDPIGSLIKRQPTSTETAIPR